MSSIQIAIMKVLSGYPGGHTSVAQLSANVALLNGSGKDWTDRMRRLSAHAPGLKILDQGFVRRDASGWYLTDAGRAFLHALEQRAKAVSAPSAGHDATELMDGNKASTDQPSSSIPRSKQNGRARIETQAGGERRFTVIEGGRSRFPQPPPSLAMPSSLAEGS